MKRSLLLLAVLGTAVAVTLTGLNVATAQEQTPGTEPATPEKPPAVEKAPRPSGEKPFAGPGGQGRGFFGHGPFGQRFGRHALHGEFTTRHPDGEGFRTHAVQTGEVTAVSKSSITVKSEDGFTRTYAVNEDTLVNAGRDGIDSVKTGDSVHVRALMEGDAARAIQVSDITNLQRLRQRWGPGRR
jgi:hypothetical protein